ncbi:diaminopimelate epimerase [Actinocorallia herbida]|uniref:Diaminopimelate epimerase n=1 Tax=Actinocorallia herbida TaxID=58109 RepID=A0A3N1D3L2_9ACTN|nr:diaminopimelate epimerase [Actinocorallia herbida]ROO88090.1 diaminopimelate epimerase [Actinocorallia herbida]
MQNSRQATASPQDAVPFRKLHGAGNDFILIDVQPTDLERDWATKARLLCERRLGIGADGLVLTARTLRDRILLVACFNADGSIATMCGNALRCAAFAAAPDDSSAALRLVMAGVEHQAIVTGGHAEVTAELGTTPQEPLTLGRSGRHLTFEPAHTGTEHFVALVEELDDLDVEGIGRAVRDHPRLAPLGTNVDFVQAVARDELRVRTYERGVEAETLSCGSGAVASFVVARRHGLVDDRPVAVHNQSGSPLTVRPHAQRPETFWVGGPVTVVYEGVLA